MEKRNQIKKIVFTGPECSGKTTLSKAISTKLNIPLVKEFARDYLNNLKRKYNYNDLLKIAQGQLKLEQNCIDSHKNAKMIICDTDMQVIRIWSQIKYNQCNSFILQHQCTNTYYILCYPGFKWVYDPLRENKTNRIKLFEKYHADLQKKNNKFIIARGSHKDRMSYVIKEILKMI